MSYQKPLPRITDEDRPFWSAAKRHELVLPRCNACGYVWFPPYESCPTCLSPDRNFVRASGRGTVWASIEMSKPYIPSFAGELPYNVVLIQLEEGPKMYSNIVGASYDRIRIGAEVEVVFEDVTEEITIPKFRLSG